MAEPIKVDGLAEFVRNLRKLGADLPKTVRLAMNDAADVIIRRTRPLVRVRTGRAAASLRAQSTRTAVRVTAGGRRAPYYPWLDFGGRVGPQRSVRRNFIKEGRYLYPTYERSWQEVYDVMVRALVDVVRGAGFEVD